MGYSLVWSISWCFPLISLHHNSPLMAWRHSSVPRNTVRESLSMCSPSSLHASVIFIRQAPGTSPPVRTHTHTTTKDTPTGTCTYVRSVSYPPSPREWGGGFIIAFIFSLVKKKNNQWRKKSESFILIKIELVQEDWLGYTSHVSGNLPNYPNHFLMEIPERRHVFAPRTSLNG